MPLPRLERSVRWGAQHGADWLGRLALIVFFLAPCAPANAEPKRVLFLSSYGTNFSPFIDYISVLRTELVRRSPQPVDIYDASLASARFAGDRDEDAFLGYLVALFEGRPLDLVIAIGAPAARFVQINRDRLFPAVPVLISAVEERRLNPEILPENDAVVPIRIEIPQLLENIVRLRPDTTTIAAVFGSSPNEKFWFEAFKRELGDFAEKFNWIWLNDLPLGDIQNRLAALPPNSAIFWGLFNVDAGGVPYEGSKALDLVRAVANAPIFSYVTSHFGRGIVGGPMIPAEDVGRSAADAAIRILGGEAAESIRPAAILFAAPRYDERELRRWHIEETNLPAGSRVEFRQPTFWEEYSWQVSLMMAVTLMQAALITKLLLERRRRRLAENESDRRLVQLAHANRTAAVRAMSASIAHEINQPLAAILNNAEAAEIVLSQNPANIELLKEILADIRRADERASRIVAGLRRLVKPKDVERQIVDLAAVIPNVVHLLDPEAKANDVKIVVEGASGTFPVSADTVHLEQVLLNLGLNAVQAIANSQAARRVICITLLKSGESAVEVSISDTGSGIPEDKLSNVFDPFFSTKPDGTGLGLSIVRSIVETYGGRIWVGNDAGSGARFSFTLPLFKHEMATA